MMWLDYLTMIEITLMALDFYCDFKLFEGLDVVK